MARSSYLKQIAKRTTLGLPVLRPPFAPFGPPAPQSLASGLQTDTLKTSTRAATDVSRTRPETPTPRSDQATPERPRASTAPEITPAPQPPASVPHSQRQPESTAPEITPAPGFSSPVSETMGPESQSLLPVRVPTGTVAESKPVVEERKAPPTSSELTNRPPAAPGMAPLRLTAEDGAVAVKIETVRHSEFPREPMLELSGPRPITQKPLPSPTAPSVHIGAIEVHIAPPTSPPAPVPPPRAQARSAASLPTTALSRGYLSTFGIRQG
jgi:hypothetical protein